MEILKKWYQKFTEGQKEVPDEFIKHMSYMIIASVFFLIFAGSTLLFHIPTFPILSLFLAVVAFLNFLRYWYYSKTGNFEVIECVCVNVSRKDMMYKRRTITVVKFDDLDKPIDKEVYFFRSSNSSIEKGMKLILYVPSNINYLNINGTRPLTTILAIKTITVIPDDVLEES